MNSKSGFALVAVLSLIATVAVVSFSTTFLTIRSVKTSENRRTHTQSKQNAESGLEIAKLYLQNEYAASNYTSLPVSLSALTSDDPEVQFTVTSYVPVQTTPPYTQVQIKIEGIAQRNARYVTEAFIEVATGGSPQDLTGFNSEAITSMNKNTVEGDLPMVNASAHGNKGFNIPNDGYASFAQCPAGYKGDYDPVLCPMIAPSGTNNLRLPVTAGIKAAGETWTHACTTNSKYNQTPSAKYCTGGVPDTSAQIPPIRFGPPPYATEKAKTFPGLGTSVFNSGCTHTNQWPPANTTPRPRVCWTMNPSMNGSYADMDIIVFNNVNITSEISLTNVNFLAVGVAAPHFTSTAKVNMTGSSLYSDTGIQLEGDVILGKGRSTIATGGDFTTTKGVTANIPVNTADDPGIKMLVGGNAQIDGNLQVENVAEVTRPDGTKVLRNKQINLHLWTGGSTLVKGNVSIRGGIQSVGNLTLEGNARVDGRSPFDSDPNTGSKILTVASRR